MIRSGGTVNNIVASVIFVGRSFLQHASPFVAYFSGEHARVSAIDVPNCWTLINTVTKDEMSATPARSAISRRTPRFVFTGLHFMVDRLVFFSQRRKSLISPCATRMID
jgi:hypothetical protein